MEIEFKRLGEVDKSSLMELMNDPMVRRQMPLFTGAFDNDACERFIETKEKIWEEHGFGPWAFVAGGEFAGWGGLQPENGEADLALVLHPRYWGIGKVIYKRIIDIAFGKMGLNSITILLPPTRTRIQGLQRLGFKEDGRLTIAGEVFIRFRLEKGRWC